MRLKLLPLLPLLLLTPAGADNTNPNPNTDTDTDTETSPFYQPRFGSDSNAIPVFLDSRNAKGAIAIAIALAKRQSNCQAGFNSCALLGAAEACCQPNAVCSRDDANNIACCPSGAACTGRLSDPSQATSSNFMFPQPGTATTTSAAITPPPTIGPTVPNAPFPFTIIPTTFPNQEACISAYTGCQVQYSSCTASLGGVNGVTIGVGGGQGGITVPGVLPTAGNPQSVCSSLSTEACHGLQAEYCTAFRDGVGSGAVAARGASNGLLYDIVVGVVVAVAGMVV